MNQSLEGICGEVDFGVPLLYITVVRLNVTSLAVRKAMGSDKMFDVIGDTFYLSAKQAGGKNSAENRKVQEKLEVVIYCASRRMEG